MKFLKFKKNILNIIIILILFFLDILTKYLFTNKIFFKNSIIYIQFVKNFGSSFGIFSNIKYYNLIIIILSIFTIFLLIYKKNYFFKNKYLKISQLLFICGILSNLYDRIFFGFVRDFIAIKYFFIFNLADLYIFLAFTIFLFFENKKESSKKIKNIK